MKRVVLIGALALAIAHLLTALPGVVGRLWRGPGEKRFPGVRNFGEVQPGLWRGGAPSRPGYRELARAGVGTVVDLRAEEHARLGQEKARMAGLHVASIPIRDGQPPTEPQLRAIADLLDEAGSIVFIHCGAGVGRTGSVIAALEVARGRPPGAALQRALSYGPLSLEQQVFILARPARPSGWAWWIVVIASRIIDSPRRLWSRGRARVARRHRDESFSS